MSMRFCASSLLIFNLAWTGTLSHAGGGGPYEAPFYSLHPDLEELLDGKVMGEFRASNPIEAITGYLHLAGLFTTQHRQLFEATIPNARVEVENGQQLFRSELDDLGITVRYISTLRQVSEPVTNNGRTYTRHYSYLNCQNDALVTAARTLQERRRQYGDDAEPLRRWVNAQLSVFENCSGEQFSLPTPPEPDWLPLEIHDRNYQVAAAYFYNNQYQEAARRFEEIASTTDSPWRDLSRYLVARSIARDALINEFEVEQNLRRALALYEEMARDDAFLASFPSAEGQIGYLQARLDPAGTRAGLSQALLEAPESLSPADLKDYLYFLSTFDPYANMDFSDDELGSWLTVVINRQRSSNQASLAGWHASRTLPWLVLSMSRADLSTPAAYLDELIAEAEAISPDSPGHFAVTRLRVRLLQMRGRHSEAYSVAVQTLNDSASSLDLGQRNLLQTLAARSADSWSDAIRLSSQLPLDLLWSEQLVAAQTEEFIYRIDRSTPLFSTESAAYLNQYLTIGRIAEALALDGLSDFQRSSLAIAGWTRAVMRDELSEALRFSETLQTLLPRLREDLRRFDQAQDKLFEAALIVMDNPAFSPWLPDHVGRIQYPYNSTALTAPRPAPVFVALPNRSENWWCVRDVNEAAEAARIEEGSVTNPLLATLDEAEIERIKALDYFRQTSATAFFGQQVIRYAEENLDDPRIPRVLHRVVFATRYACTSGPGPVSQQAFALLHRHFPDSDWAERTPYWFQ